MRGRAIIMRPKTWMTACTVPALLGFILLAGCGKKESTEEQPASPAAAPAAAATPIDPATAASVSGTVKLDGEAPKAAKIDMSQDPACKGTNTAENVVASGGHLANVFVYVKEGLGGRTFDVPSDPTTHNIHPTPKDNREWNESQPPQAAPLVKNFAREEIMLPVKCNQHPWMRMFLNVTKSPFYAVTGPDGKFEIKGLPPGDYTLAFVHEKLGEQTMKVTLAAKDSKTVDATFKP